MSGCPYNNCRECDRERAAAPEQPSANWQERGPGHYDPPDEATRALILSPQGLADTRRKATEMLTDFWVHDDAKVILTLLDALEAAPSATGRLWHSDGDECIGIHCGNPEHGYAAEGEGT